MKYARLTKEQFEALHTEFINFLATQSIDKNEWDTIKTNQPQIAEQELDVFSDLIWEGVLSQAQFLEHFSKSHGFLFNCDEAEMHSIVLHCPDPKVDLLTIEGMKYLGDNLFTDAIEIRIGTKIFSGDRNADIFGLIQQGAILSDGEFYRQLKNVMDS
ncbi:DUF6495 family protein [Flavobacterium silvaticum]|uniref:Histidyl-tRNA synthetase n=1 Tax=Flavobacterium silvaticum TaxID=1852020 RepID=A0A972FV74_9FLAO|nr:DUF6495 family protein [Flavobacterium silvaticum]NMH29138.1 hypothetical protein [Flavobacterium silvaticum]